MVRFDMDMPERCAGCYFADGIKMRCTAPAGRRLPIGFGFLWKRRPKWCPLGEDNYTCPFCGRSPATEGGMSVSILIKGAEMPNKKNGAVFIIYPDGKCAVEDGETYQAVPVPPHGRLVDADKQDPQIEALIERHLHGYTQSTWDFVCELRDILKRDRTIIDAEPPKENNQ